MKPYFCRQTISSLKRFTKSFFIYRNAQSALSVSFPTFFDYRNPRFVVPVCSNFSTVIFSLPEKVPSEISDVEEKPDTYMDEFLSRFVWIMRGKILDVYPDCDKEKVNSMLIYIVQKVLVEMEKGTIDQKLEFSSRLFSQDLSEDLWKTVWEVSNSVVKDMRKEKRRETMKKVLQDEDVRKMVRFAGDIGIRGDMLRELRLKWAREKMEEIEFYEELKQLQTESEKEKNEEKNIDEGNTETTNVEAENTSNDVSLPERHGKIKYKIYGLDLSDPKWANVAYKTHDSWKVISPPSPKDITGKCKLVTEKILDLKEDDNLSPLLTEWIELLQPERVDWLGLLERLRERNAEMYLKIFEHLLNEESFVATVRDYSKLIDILAKENRVIDVERILMKMMEKGIELDILTLMTLVYMYGRAGNLNYMKKAFENLRSRGFHPNKELYSAVIIAYVNAGQPKSGESLTREMEVRDIKPTKEMYMELLRAFAHIGHADGAQRIVNSMQFAGYPFNLESCTLLVEAYGKAGDPDQARNNFDYMMTNHKPDDQCVASMISAYEKNNTLDKAINLLLELEKKGIELGVATYTVLVDWFGKLQLVDEAENFLHEIRNTGELSFKIHVILCDMYSRAGVKQKALEALEILEAKKELLHAEEFERIVSGLLAGGFTEEAKRVHKLMENQGFTSSEHIKVALMAAKIVPRPRPKAR